MKYLAYLLLLVFSGCASVSYYELPYEFRFPQKKNEFIKNNSKYLSGKKFYLDPGHGGEDRRNTGFKGKTIEADVNLAVALKLKKLLTEAGAAVILSRERDETVVLKDRSILANKSGADYFISIHHNAPPDSGDIWTNYTATYYHATENDYEFDPAEKDLAKYIQRDLAYAMRNSGGTGSFDGTYSDYSIYPKQGFSVLRLTEIPSVLVECGFTTSQFESGRLTIEEFNEIQAWGIFKGLCRYLASGQSEIRFDQFSSYTSENNLEMFIKDSNGIDPLSVKVFIDSIRTTDFQFQHTIGKLTIPLKNLKEGEHDLKVIASNKKGKYAPALFRKFLIRKQN